MAIIGNKKLDYIFLFGIILCIVPFFLISYYNAPSAFDDFGNAYNVRTRGEIGFMSYLYHNWSGRFTLGLILAYFNPLNYNGWHLGIMLAPLFYLTFLIGAIYFFLQGILHQIDKQKVQVIALALMALFLNNVSTVAELIYWFSGAATYTAGIIFFLIGAGFLLRFTSTQNISIKVILIICVSLSLVLAIGTNEALLMGLCFLLFIVFIQALRTKAESKYIIGLVFVIGLATSFVSLKAPGNFIRTKQMYTEDVSYAVPMAKAVFKSVYFTLIHIVGWLNSFALIVGSVLLVPVLQTFLRKTPSSHKWLRIHPVLVLFLIIIFLSVQAFPSFFGTGDAEPRVWSSIYFFFLLSWFYLLLVLIQFFANRSPTFVLPAWLKIVFVCLLLISGDGNINRAYFDLITRAHQYKQNLINRYAEAEKLQNSNMVVTPVFERKYQYPTTLFSSDLSVDSTNGRNLSFSHFFGLKSVRLVKEPR